MAFAGGRRALVTAMVVSPADAPPLEIGSFRQGQKLDGLLFLERATSGLARNGKWYVRVSCRDRARATIDGTLWDYSGEAPRAGVYRVVASVEPYKGSLQLKLLQPPVHAAHVDPAPYRAAVTPERASATRLREKFCAALEGIQDHRLNALVTNVFDEETLRQFFHAPAAVQQHGCFPGGLAYHTLRVWELALHQAMVDGGARCNLDLLAAGALLHDVGKIDEMEYSYEHGQVVLRKEPALGRLHGHMICGVRRIDRAAFELGIEKERVVEHLIHLVASHHGKPEWGAPVAPAMVEARLLHAADLCAAEVEVTLDVLDQVNTRSEGEWLDGGAGRPRLYLGSPVS